MGDRFLSREGRCRNCGYDHGVSGKDGVAAGTRNETSLFCDRKAWNQTVTKCSPLSHADHHGEPRSASSIRTWKDAYSSFEQTSLLLNRILIFGSRWLMQYPRTEQQRIRLNAVYSPLFYFSPPQSVFRCRGRETIGGVAALFAL